MNQTALAELLSELPLGGIRYFNSIGSTNDEALAWASKRAEDLSLVVADEQTLGRGRHDRKWFTPPRSALAFSLLLRPTEAEKPFLSRAVGLAALALSNVLQPLGLDPRIKWPNDILLDGRKLAGTLIETTWAEDEVTSLVIGMGINISKAAVPSTDILNFPGTSLESALGSIPDRWNLLRDILSNIMVLRPYIGTESIMSSWETKLAYYGRQVRVEMGGGRSVSGKVTGLESDGSLKVQDENNKTVTVRFGDVRLRPFT